MDAELSPRDRELIAGFHDPDRTLHHVAADSRMTLLELCEWAAQAHIAPVLARIQQVNLLRTRCLLAEARAEALAALRRVIASDACTAHEEITRRAANNLLHRFPLDDDSGGDSTCPRGTGVPPVSTPPTPSPHASMPRAPMPSAQSNAASGTPSSPALSASSPSAFLCVPSVSPCLCGERQPSPRHVPARPARLDHVVRERPQRFP